jgi:flagellar protein FlgJ
MNAAGIYTDFQGLERLKGEARGSTPSKAAVDEVARQFEALFLQMVLRSMREASLGDDGLMESDATRDYRELFDSQLAINLAQSRSLGIAEIIGRQIGAAGDAGIGDREVPAAAPARKHGSVAAAAHTNAGNERTQSPASPAEFTTWLWPDAVRAGRKLGVDPEMLVAQAALETGWGRSVMQHPDGRSSFNLFGIKADPGWAGNRVTKDTLEYEDGIVVKRRAEFRAYESCSEAFEDYARFLHTPRYQAARAQAADASTFAHALQKAGYATDPTYGKKINDIMNGTTLAQAMSGLKSAGARTIR